MAYAFDWSSIARAWPYLLEGLAMTGFLLVVAMAFGIALGAVLALAKMFGPKPLAMAVGGYVNFFRAIPLILTIFWVFFLVAVALRAITGDPYLTVGPIWSALAAFILAESAYYCEIIRAGVGSVRVDQMRAAQALGLNRFQALFYVVLPQAFRNMAPSLVNQSVALLKDTSLVYVISLSDFLGAAGAIGQRDGRMVELYLFAAAVYLALCSLGVWVAGRLQSAKGRYA
jgi:glutamate/aspartate transport system permease protein